MGKKKKMCGIYKITNMVNGKVYIGQTNDIYTRWRKHKYTYENPKENNQVIYRAMRKYGLENFSFEIILECEEWELNEWEIYFIEIYKSYINRKDSNGYNQNKGGGGVRGLKMSKETKEKMKKSKKNISKETKQKMKENHADVSRGKHPNAKKVICENKVFDCARDCAEYYNKNYGTVLCWLNHDNPMPEEWYLKGLRYEDEDIENYKYYTKDHRKGKKVIFTEEHKKNISEATKGRRAWNKKSVTCENIKFSCAKDCAIYYLGSENERSVCNLEKNIGKWLRKERKMPKEWSDRGLCYTDESNT